MCAINSTKARDISVGSLPSCNRCWCRLKHENSVVQIEQAMSKGKKKYDRLII